MVKETFGDLNWENKVFGIGLKRADADGEFQWPESQSQLNFTKWAPNNPSGKKGCTGIATTRYEGHHFSWFTKRCDRFFLKFLCEK